MKIKKIHVFIMILLLILSIFGYMGINKDNVSRPMGYQPPMNDYITMEASGETIYFHIQGINSTIFGNRLVNAFRDDPILKASRTERYDGNDYQLICTITTDEDFYFDIYSDKGAYASFLCKALIGEKKSG